MLEVDQIGQLKQVSQIQEGYLLKESLMKKVVHTVVTHCNDKAKS